MPIKKIRVSNFKTLKDLELELGNFNVLIGANASGKSNFLQIFRFLRDIVKHGLDNAISLQGGIEYLRNMSIGSTNNLMLEVVFEPQKMPTRYVPYRIEEGSVSSRLGIYVREITYKLILSFKRKGFKIADEKLTMKCKFTRREFLDREGIERTAHSSRTEDLGQGEVIFSKVDGRVNTEVNLPTEIGEIPKDSFLIPGRFFLFFEDRPFRSTLLETETYLMSKQSNIFHSTEIYDFDPKLLKKAVPITAKAELEEDGSNLATVIKNIVEDKDKERKFSNLVKDLLPFVQKVDVEKFADKSLLFKLKENYFKKQYLPASLISDGTINITALIVTLYFDRKQVTIIEEPERNIHPYLISKVIGMMKDASQGKQIIITTHNPEVIKWAGLENILFVSRDKEGFSTISKLHEKESIKIFLENEIGIDELYIQNLLAV